MASGGCSANGTATFGTSSGQETDPDPTPDPDPVPALAHEGCAEIDEPIATADERLEAFTLLTGTSWQGLDCGDGINGIPFRCDQVSLLPDGTYTWSARSDFLERDESGTWNFFARSASSGTLFFSNGSSDLFIFDEATGVLETGRALLRRAEAQPGLGTADALPEVRPPGLYRGLLSSCWRKTNDFDDHRIPDTVTFGPTGSYRASYRQGECEHGGSFAVDDGNLVRAAEANDCASGEKGDLPGFLAEVIDGLLVFWEGAYRPAADQTTERSFFIDPARPGTAGFRTPQEAEAGTYESVRVIGRYEGAFTQGYPTDLHFSLENMGTRPVRLRELWVEMKALAEDLVTTATDYHSLGSFAGERLDPNETIDLATSFVPAASGELVPARFALTFTDYSGLPRENRIDVVLPIQAGISVPFTPPPEPGVPPATQSPPSYSPCGGMPTQYTVESAAFSPDGAVLAFGMAHPDGTVPLLDVATMTLLATIPSQEMPQSDVTDVAFGEGLLARAVRGRLEAFRLTDGQWIPSFSWGEYENWSYFSLLALSPDGTTLAAGMSGGINLYSAESGEWLDHLRIGEPTDRSFAAYAPDGRIASLGDSPVVRLWDPSTLTLLRVLDDHTARAMCGGFAGNDLLLTGSHDQTLVVWDPEQGRVLRRIEVGEGVQNCALLPDGTIAATTNTRLVLYRSDDGGGPLVLGSGGTALAVSPDGTRIAAGGSIYCRDAVP
ncbi:MAG TPA: WD40 repeat domain-containing protein [Polyangiaceae bacterium]